MKLWLAVILSPLFILRSFADSALVAAASAGTSTIVLTELPTGLTASSPSMGYVVVDPYTLNCEVRNVASVSGNSVTLRGADAFPLLYPHGVGTKVLWLSGDQLIPWPMFGGVPNDSSLTAAANNSIGWNRCVTNLHALRRGFGIGGIFVPAGMWEALSELWMEQSMAFYGMAGDQSTIRAHPAFVTSTNGEIALLHGMRDGVICTFAGPGGPLARYYLRDICLDGNNVPNMNGALVGFQQPAEWENVRFNNFPGTYCWAISAAQDFRAKRIQFLNSRRGLYLRSVSIARFETINFEQMTQEDVLANDLTNSPGGNFQVTFENVHIEELSGRQISMDLQGWNWDFNGVWYSNADTNAIGILFRSITNVGASSFYGEHPLASIKNMHAHQPSTGWKMVVDEGGGQSITATEANRSIPNLVLAPVPFTGTNGAFMVWGRNGERAIFGTPRHGSGATLWSRVSQSGAYHFDFTDGKNSVATLNVAGEARFRGGYISAVKTAFSTNYAATAYDEVLICTGTNQVITLPATSTIPAGKKYVICAASSGGSVVVATVVGTVLQASSITVNATNRLAVVSDGNNYQ